MWELKLAFIFLIIDVILAIITDIFKKINPINGDYPEILADLGILFFILMAICIFLAIITAIILY
jgi:hypothetical protein